MRFAHLVVVTIALKRGLKCHCQYGHAFRTPSAKHMRSFCVWIVTWEIGVRTLQICKCRIKNDSKLSFIACSIYFLHARSTPPGARSALLLSSEVIFLKICILFSGEGVVVPSRTHTHADNLAVGVLQRMVSRKRVCAIILGNGRFIGVWTYG